jgi:hypothetical protein
MNIGYQTANRTEEIRNLLVIHLGSSAHIRRLLGQKDEYLSVRRNDGPESTRQLTSTVLDSNQNISRSGGLELELFNGEVGVLVRVGDSIASNV